MGYSNEVMQRARARLAAAKADRESENRQHLDEAYATLYAQKCTIFRCNLPPKKMHFLQCRGFICNKCPTYLSPKSSHTSRQIGILHYSIKVFVGYWDILPYYPSHRRKRHYRYL